MEITDLVYIDSTGYHFADYPSFLAWLQDKYRGVYGADTYLEADSQDGQWVAIQATAFYDMAALGAATYNSFSPTSAQGTGLARLVKINGLEKLSPSKSTVDLLVVGQAAKVITNGIATDALQQKWILPTPTTIPGGGSITVTAEAENAGAVAAAANTVTTIFTPTQGWQTVNNPLAATPGAPVESDPTLRARQAVSTADPSLTVLEGTSGAVSNLAGVTKVRAYENDTGSTDGNGLLAHKISIVVVGGVSAAIAEEIALHKTPGGGTQGNTTVSVPDAAGNTIAINFERATTATVSARITLASRSGWSTDYEALIKAAVAAAINAGSIGKNVLLTKMFPPAYLNGTPPGQTYDITLIELKKNAGSFSAADITIAWNENPFCDSAVNVTLVVT